MMFSRRNDLERPGGYRGIAVGLVAFAVFLLVRAWTLS